jgi:flagellar assembly protein FliH
MILREASIDLAAVRLRRNTPALAPTAAAQAPLAAPNEASGYELGLKRGHEEGLRLGSEEGHRSGYAEGLMSGLAEAGRRTEEAVAAAVQEQTRLLRDQCGQLTTWLQALQAERQAILAGAEDDIAAICFETLCRVLGASVTTAEGIRGQVTVLLAGVQQAGAAVVHLHPQDEAVVREGGILLQGQAISFVADDRVALGGCVVHHRAGSIDGRLETIVEHLRKAVSTARATPGVAK